MKLSRTPETSTRSPSFRRTGPADGSAIDVGHLVAGTEVVTVIALIDLRGPYEA